MVKKVNKEGRDLYKCEECFLYYPERVMAERCEAWDKEHHTCNIDFIKDAIEVSEDESR